MEDIDLATQTMFAELLQRSLDAEFDQTFSEQGTFRRKKSNGRYYWHHQQRVGNQVVSKYVGPVTDPSITDRVNRFTRLKNDYKRRQEMVRALLATGLPEPEPHAGAVVEAMWKAGFFRLRGVLVGTLAFQAYAGPLGIRFARRPLMTQDVDFAQFWGISQNIGESMRPPVDVLRDIDPTFEQVPHVSDPFVSTQYRNAAGYRVDFLTPNRGAAEHASRPARMCALAGSGAQGLRHLDFLIHHTERSVLLYKGGIPVTIPRAERYAIHKLIVAADRIDQTKSDKDLLQAETLINTLATRRPLELADAWRTAWNTGPRWREKLDTGRERLPAPARDKLDEAIRRGRASRQRIRHDQ